MSRDFFKKRIFELEQSYFLSRQKIVAITLDLNRRILEKLYGGF